MITVRPRVQAGETLGEPDRLAGIEISGDVFLDSDDFDKVEAGTGFRPVVVIYDEGVVTLRIPVEKVDWRDR